MSAEPPQDLQLFLALMLASHKTFDLVRREFARTGVDASNWGILQHISARGSATPSQLAEEIGISMPTIRDQLQGLVDRDLVKRVPNPLDGRSYFVVLTPAGRTALRRGLAASERVQAALEKLAGPLEPLRGQLLAVIAAAGRLHDDADTAERARAVEQALRRS